jgi:hypothetical protein
LIALDATGSKENLTQAERNAGNVAEKSLKRKILEPENAGSKKPKKRKTGETISLAVRARSTLNSDEMHSRESRTS